MQDLTFPRRARIVLLAPALAVFCAFWLLPIVQLLKVSTGGHVVATYFAVLTDPRYLRSLFNTVVLSAAVTAVSLLIASVCGVFLARRAFPGKALLVSVLSFPLIFPGVVVGFMVIMLAGRQGLIGLLSMHLFGERWVFAYSMAGLFVGYLYFSIPKALATMMAAAEKIDPALEEAARALGASPWAVVRDVLIPALKPSLHAAGAICFATSMGAFGTAFTLATEIDVLPMTIYTAFTLNADMTTAAALSVVLGVVTWCVLAWAGDAA